MSMLDALLTAYLHDRPKLPFNWGSNNCAIHFVAGWVLLATGQNPCATIEVADQESAVKLIGSYGSLGNAVTSILGRETIPWTFARSGDIVLIESDLPGTGQALGICTGRLAVFLDLAGECRFLRMSRSIAAWKLKP